MLEIEQNLPVLPNKAEYDYFVRSICDNEVHKLQATLIALAKKLTSDVNKQLSVQEFSGEQSMEDVRKKAAASVGMSGSQYRHDILGLFICKASVNGALQKVLQKLLQAHG